MGGAAASSFIGLINAFLSLAENEGEPQATQASEIEVNEDNISVLVYNLLRLTEENYFQREQDFATFIFVLDTLATSGILSYNYHQLLMEQFNLQSHVDKHSSFSPSVEDVLGDSSTIQEMVA
jgi:hypothetical protein